MERGLTAVEPANDYVDWPVRARAEPDFEHYSKRCHLATKERDVGFRNLAAGVAEPTGGFVT